MKNDKLTQAEQALRDCLRLTVHGLGAAMFGFKILREVRNEAMRYWPAAAFLNLSLPDLACEESSPAVRFLQSALVIDPGARSPEVGKVLALATGEEGSAVLLMAKSREVYAAR